MKISYKQALLIVEKFLDRYYLKNRWDDLGLLLSDMSLDTFVGNDTADAAAWEDWLDAIQEVAGKRSNGYLNGIEVFNAMIVYIKKFGMRIKSKEILCLLDQITVNDGSPKEDVLVFWLECVNEIGELSKNQV